MAGLTDFLAWALVHIGVLYFVTESALGSPFRRLLTRGMKPSNLLVGLIYCPGCCGFWLGLIEGALGITVFPTPTYSWMPGDQPLPWVLAEPHALTVLTGFAGMGLGAAWAQTRPMLGVIFQLEQGIRHDETGKSEATAGPAGGDAAGDDGDEG